MGGGVAEHYMGESGQNVQTSSYKISNSWGCNSQHGNYNYNNTALYIRKLLEIVDLKNSYQKKKI